MFRLIEALVKTVTIDSEPNPTIRRLGELTHMAVECIVEEAKNLPTGMDDLIDSFESDQIIDEFVSYARPYLEHLRGDRTKINLISNSELNRWDDLFDLDIVDDLISMMNKKLEQVK